LARVAKVPPLLSAEPEEETAKAIARATKPPRTVFKKRHLAEDSIVACMTIGCFVKPTDYRIGASSVSTA
jgi:hypothetical protein